MDEERIQDTVESGVEQVVPRQQAAGPHARPPSTEVGDHGLAAVVPVHEDEVQGALREAGGRRLGRGVPEPGPCPKAGEAALRLRVDGGGANVRVDAVEVQVREAGQEELRGDRVVDPDLRHPQRGAALPRRQRPDKLRENVVPAAARRAVKLERGERRAADRGGAGTPKLGDREVGQQVRQHGAARERDPERQVVEHADSGVGLDRPQAADERRCKVRVIRGESVPGNNVRRSPYAADPARAAAGLGNLPEERRNGGDECLLGRADLRRRKTVVGARVPHEAAVSILHRDAPGVVSMLPEDGHCRSKSPERRVGVRRQARLQ
mmetsp:Transcript_156132/g.479173  ORF Transcript_156132/g.479173 Transcript_156132/m.479173 type:complete len:323 (+) Transcript_156132:174-1142(+)